MFSFKWKLYALAALAFAAALFGWHRAGIKAALDRERAQANERRLKAITTKQRIKRDVDHQSDSDLIDDISRD